MFTVFSVLNYCDVLAVSVHRGSGTIPYIQCLFEGSQMLKHDEMGLSVMSATCATKYVAYSHVYVRYK